MVVTGSGSGIGAHTARRFAAEGANVIIADINLPAAERVAASIDGSFAIEVDVTSRDALRSMVDVATNKFGGVDILVNNAMSCGQARFLDATPDEVRQDFAVTVIGPFFASQEVIPATLDHAGDHFLTCEERNLLLRQRGVLRCEGRLGEPHEIDRYSVRRGRHSMQRCRTRNNRN